MEASFRHNHTDIAHTDFLLAICSVFKNLDYFLQTHPSFIFFFNLSILVLFIKGSVSQFSQSAS